MSRGPPPAAAARAPDSLRDRPSFGITIPHRFEESQTSVDNGEYRCACTSTVFIASLRIRSGGLRPLLGQLRCQPRLLPLSPRSFLSRRHHHYPLGQWQLPSNSLSPSLFLSVWIMHGADRTVSCGRFENVIAADGTASAIPMGAASSARRPPPHRQASPQQQRRMQLAVLPDSAALSHGTARSSPCVLFRQCDCAALSGGTVSRCAPSRPPQCHSADGDTALVPWARDTRCTAIGARRIAIAACRSTRHCALTHSRARQSHRSRSSHTLGPLPPLPSPPGAAPASHCCPLPPLQRTPRASGTTAAPSV